ncbi:MAG: EAL domain-containing protein [Thermoanaerobaculia bacterium]
MSSATEHSELAELLRRGFYSIAFQPIFRMAENAVFGFEALLRGPAGTPLAQPSRVFHSTSIDRDLMHEIDTACILAAVRSGRVLAANHKLFVNVHGETLFRFSQRMADLLDLLDLLGMEPDQVVLEISETTDKAHVRSIARSLKTLRRRGMKVALDDVGARYAWLHHMLWLEPEYLKIDKVFVSKIHLSQKKRRLVGAIADMARTMGAHVVVEGIEQEAERAVIKELGIEFGQGFLLGRPLAVQHWIEPNETTATRVRVAGLWE